ncbi:MAG: hypothetical protein ACRDHE_14875, partial [Ktedonobacterales bacterium]
MPRSPYRTLKWLVALCPLVLVAIAGSSVSAQSAHSYHQSPGLPSSAPPLGVGDLVTSGGHIEGAPITYIIFWGSAWNSGGAVTSDGQIAVNYLSDRGQTGYEKIVSQYYDSSTYINPSQSLTPYWIDTTNPPTDTSCGSQTVQDAAIQNEINHAISVNGWNKDSVNATYFIYTPTGASVNDGSGNCSETQYCSYHKWSSSLSVAYAVIPYPNDMTACGVPSSPNGNVAGDSLANLTAQTQTGAITDPDAATGWADSSGYEAGAKCAWDFSNGPTTLNNGGVFELSSQYSNATHGCVTNLPPTGDSIGVFRTSTTQFSLRNSPSSGPADNIITYGSTTDIPITGDWNGDGIDTVGVYNPVTGQFFLSDINASGMPVTHVFTF